MASLTINPAQFRKAVQIPLSSRNRAARWTLREPEWGECERGCDPADLILVDPQGEEWVLGHDGTVYPLPEER
jgi:hypothetical protein